ncbi:hypothetical protein WHYPHY_19 [Bacillus phage WhyPhy]|uniref:Minor structural protein n=1 Tax=Bacillus phage WhyPhy TaxID=2801480 RepID=A0A7T7ZAM5_9CAUD|nr:hypothetical protein KNV75_gp19 [Bacillus phage WhyPhy]QQO40327.1 hypothetical protein WHYPHY_19 [Bacillus phage WhyPhy]
MDDKKLSPINYQTPLLDIQPYPYYLPTANDGSLTMLEKVNAIIYHLQYIDEIFKDIVDKWNELVKWLEDGMKKIVEDILAKWLEDGTIEELLKGALKDYVTRKELEQELSDLMDKITKQINEAIDALFIRESTTYTIGEGGDYPTLNKAVDALSEKIVANRGQITWKILKDHELKEQVFLEGLNLSYVTIISEDERVNVDTRYLTQDVEVKIDPEYTVTPIFYCKNGSLPNIGTIFDLCNCGDKINACGAHLDNSDVRILSGAGFLNASYIGVSAVNGSSVVAHGGTVDNSGNRSQVVEGGSIPTRGDGFRIWNSTLSATYATANRCGDVGFNISQGSSAQLNSATATNCGHHNILVTSGSQASARRGVFDDALDDCVTVYAGGALDARYASMLRGGASGIVVTRGSSANIEYAKTSGKNGGIYANRASQVDAYGATANDSGTNAVTAGNASTVNFIYGEAKNAQQDALHCTHGSTINAHQAVLTNAGRNGILAYAGDVMANEADVSGAKNHGVEATRGSRIVLNRGKANDCGVRGALATQSTIDMSYVEALRAGQRGMEATQGGSILAYSSNTTGATEWGYAVYNGANISCVDATGSMNRDPNTLTSNGYILR